MANSYRTTVGKSTGLDLFCDGDLEVSLEISAELEVRVTPGTKAVWYPNDRAHPGDPAEACIVGGDICLFSGEGEATVEVLRLTVEQAEKLFPKLIERWAEQIAEEPPAPIEPEPDWEPEYED